MVISTNERSAKKPAKQGFAEETRKPIQINGSTHYDFEGRNLTAYGGLLPVATMLEKLKFQQLVEDRFGRLKLFVGDVAAGLEIDVV